MTTDKNYCPECEAFLPGEEHKPMCTQPGVIDFVVSVVKEFFSWDHSDRHEQVHEHTQD